MSNIVLPNTLTNGQPNDADEVMADLAAILAVVNGDIDLGNVATSLANAFLKLLAPGDHKVAWGTKVLGNLDSAAGRSKVAAVQTHGLGGTPVFAIASQMNTIGVTEEPLNHICAVGVQVTSTDMTITAVAPGTSNNSVSVFWLAIR